MTDTPADPATASYFAATADGWPFDSQRDAYEAGYEQGRADERDNQAGLNSEHGEAILEECGRLVHGMFVQEACPPLAECVQIARAVIKHATPYITSDAHDDGYAKGRTEEREGIRQLAAGAICLGEDGAPCGRPVADIIADLLDGHDG